MAGQSRHDRKDNSGAEHFDGIGVFVNWKDRVEVVEAGWS